MNRRTLSIAGAVIRETLRRRVTPLIAVFILLAVPLICILFGDDTGMRQWLARSATADGLATLMPLAAVIGGAFLLQPGFRKGWTLLPARRGEQFAATCIGGSVILAGTALLFTIGAVAANLAFGGDLVETESPDNIAVQRFVDDGRQTREGRAADPTRGEELFFEIPSKEDEIRGSIEYQVFLPADPGAGGRRVVDVYVRDADGRRKAETAIQSRYRVRFNAPVKKGPVRVIVRPINPSFGIVSSAGQLRVETGRASPFWSIAALLGVAVGASLMGLMFVLAVRSRATATTAALAGTLLLAVLTLMPSLAPAQKMARDRRTDVGGEVRDRSLLEELNRTLSSLPSLIPRNAVNEFVSGRKVPSSAWLDGAMRLGVGLVLVVPGALLYSRREVAK